MSDFSDKTIISGNGAPVAPMSMMETWKAAVTQPREETFARIAAQPGATATKAFLWVFLASLLTSLVSVVASLGGQQMESLRQLLPPELANQLPVGSTPAMGVGAVICGVPVGAIFAVLGFAIATGLIQWIAKLFGGTGTYDKLAYTFSAITVPYSVIAAGLALLAIIPYVGILTGMISFVLSIYVLVLEVLAVKAVDRLDTGRAAGSVLLPVVLIFFIVCCCLVVVASVLAPVMQNSFQGMF